MRLGRPTGRGAARRAVAVAVRVIAMTVSFTALDLAGTQRATHMARSSSSPPRQHLDLTCRRWLLGSLMRASPVSGGT